MDEVINELQGEIARLQDELDQMRMCVAESEQMNLELRLKVERMTTLFSKQSELYIDASYRLKQYEQMDKVKRIETI